MKLRSLLLVVIILFASVALSACGTHPPEEETTFQVSYYSQEQNSSGNYSWMGTTYEYIVEGELAPDKSIEEAHYIESNIGRYDDVIWYADAEYTTLFDFTQPITENIRIYGDLQVKDVFTITYYVGDTVYLTQSVNNGDNIIEPADPSTDFTKETSWATHPTEWTDNQFSGFNDPARKDITLYAYFFNKR